MGFGKIVRECAVPITHCTFQWLDPNFGTHNPVARVLRCCVPDRICSPSLACVDNLDPHGSTTQIQNGGNESICPVFCDVIRNAWHVEPQFDELVPEFCLPFSEEVKLDIENLQHAYNLLADKLQENLWYSQAYITEYSDPTQDDNGELCNGLLFPDAVTEKFTTVGSVLLGLPPDGLISQDEIAWAHSDVISPLNQQVQNAAARHGRTYIEGEIASQFSTHGYCADDHWIVRYDESKNIQENSDGTMHPNLLGQFVYRDQISAALISDLNRDLFHYHDCFM